MSVIIIDIMTDSVTLVLPIYSILDTMVSFTLVFFSEPVFKSHIIKTTPEHHYSL